MGFKVPSRVSEAAERDLGVRSEKVLLTARWSPPAARVRRSATSSRRDQPPTARNRRCCPASAVIRLRVRRFAATFCQLAAVDAHPDDVAGDAAVVERAPVDGEGRRAGPASGCISGIGGVVSSAGSSVGLRDRRRRRHVGGDDRGRRPLGRQIERAVIGGFCALNVNKLRIDRRPAALHLLDQDVAARR